MDIDATFLPIAETLIDSVFPTAITYHQISDRRYDTSTGKVETATTVYEINAGVLKRARSEQGGAGETYTLELYIHHGAKGMPFQPRTGDQVMYDGVCWKVTTVDPGYSSKKGIASKLTCMAAN